MLSWCALDSVRVDIAARPECIAGDSSLHHAPFSEIPIRMHCSVVLQHHPSRETAISISKVNDLLARDARSRVRVSDKERHASNDDGWLFV